MSLPFGEPPNFPWDPNGTMPVDLNPYGHWDGRANKTLPLCRLTEPLYLCSMCGENTPEDPTGFQRYFVIFIHLLTFVAPIVMLYGIYVKFDVIKTRVYSPFLLIFGSAIFEAASMAEVASHAFTMNWNSCYDTADTPMKLFFYSFTAVGFTGLTIAYRKANNPLCRKPTGLFDGIVLVIDWVLIVTSLSTPLLYLVLGKNFALKGFTVVQSISAFVGIPRIWKNLGPTTFLLFLGAASQMMSIVGVGVNVWMQRTGNQYLHALLGFFFALNEFGIGYCFLLTEKEGKPTNKNGEGAPLLRSFSGGSRV